MKPISCLIVDDERHARHLIRQQISEYPELQLLGEADRMESARIAIDSVKPEVVFLDIGLPDGDGMDLASMPGAHIPLWVFVTAYEQRAVHAFEVEACDFLTKPVQTERFRKTLRRLSARLRPGVTPISNPRSTADPVATSPTDSAMPIFVKVGSAGRFLSLNDILWIQADRNETRVRLAGGQELLVRQSIREWLRSLPDRTFIKVDRSVVIHTRRIQHAQMGARHAKVRFDGEAQSLLLGRPAASRLRAAMKCLGMDLV